MTADTRIARVKGAGYHDQDRVAQYLPDNYKVQWDFKAAELLIMGTDNAGWTLEDYVIPRLASGLIFAEVIQ